MSSRLDTESPCPCCHKRNVTDCGAIDCEVYRRTVFYPSVGDTSVWDCGVHDMDGGEWEE